MKTRFIKLIGIICALTCLTTACTHSSDNSPSDTVEQNQQSEQITDGSAQNKETSYWDLKCRSIKERSDLHFDIGLKSDLALSFSKDWVLEKSFKGKS